MRIFLGFVTGLGLRRLKRYFSAVQEGAKLSSCDVSAAANRVTRENATPQPPVDGVPADAADLGYL